MAEVLKRLKHPIAGKISVENPIYVRMLTRGRGVHDFVVEEITKKGVVIQPEWAENEQIYRVGSGGRSYDVYVHRETGKRHVIIYEGMSTPPTHLVEGKWRDADPAADAEWNKYLSSFEAAADLLNIEEPLPAWFWPLIVLAGLPWAVRIVEIFVT